MQSFLNWAGAAIGVIVTFAFGSWQEPLTVLLVAMGIDYITGVTAAVKQKNGLSSIVGSWGLARKGLSLLIILLAHRIDLLLGLQNMVMSASVYFYLTNELISVIENYGRLGLPLPDRLREIIAVLKKKEK